jgi:hypothetical protein
MRWWGSAPLTDIPGPAHYAIGRPGKKSGTIGQRDGPICVLVRHTAPFRRRHLLCAADYGHKSNIRSVKNRNIFFLDHANMMVTTESGFRIEFLDTCDGVCSCRCSDQCHSLKILSSYLMLSLRVLF